MQHLQLLKFVKNYTLNLVNQNQLFTVTATLLAGPPFLSTNKLMTNQLIFYTVHCYGS